MPNPTIHTYTTATVMPKGSASVMNIIKNAANSAIICCPCGVSMTVSPASVNGSGVGARIIASATSPARISPCLFFMNCCIERLSSMAF